MPEPMIPTQEEYINLLNAYAHHALELFNAGDAKVKLLLHGLTKNQVYEISLAGIFTGTLSCIKCPNDDSCMPPGFPCHPFGPGMLVPPRSSFPPIPPVTPVTPVVPVIPVIPDSPKLPSRPLRSRKAAAKKKK